ncbi:MAG: hypothetical protein KAR87_01230 [Candidatus Aenigmarchaeota archaeon]|nr:hypothetical protein [Candidatus Aenigmarchaeota archaeon]
MVDLITSFKETITSPLLYASIMEALKNITVAMIIIIIGYIIAKILGMTTKKLLYKIGLDKYFIDNGLDHAVGRASVSGIVGEIVKWYVWALFLIPSITILQLGEMSAILLDFVRWIPSLLIGSVIVIGGLIVSEFLAKKIRNLTFRFKNQMALVVKMIVLFFFADVALVEIGLNITLIENTFLILLGGMVFTLALAIGIGLGFALKENGKEVIEELKKDFKKIEK